MEYIKLGRKHTKYMYKQSVTCEISSIVHKEIENKLVYVLHFCAPIMRIERHAAQQQYGGYVEQIEKELRIYIKKTLFQIHNTQDNTLEYHKYILDYQQAMQGQKNTLSMYPTLDLYISFENKDKTKYRPFKQLAEQLKPILNNLIDEWVNIIEQYDFKLLEVNNRKEKISASNKQRNNVQYIKKKPLSEYTEEELAERKKIKKEYTQQYYQLHKKEFKERNQQYYKSQSPQDRKEYQKQYQKEYRQKKKLEKEKQLDNN